MTTISAEMCRMRAQKSGSDTLVTKRKKRASDPGKNQGMKPRGKWTRLNDMPLWYLLIVQLYHNSKFLSAYFVSPARFKQPTPKVCTLLLLSLSSHFHGSN